MSKKMVFIWKLPGWTWESIKYEGNGIFYGKVTSPYVPTGEYGTWYLWEIEGQGAKLVKGDKQLLDKIRKQSKKKAEMQRILMG